LLAIIGELRAIWPAAIGENPVRPLACGAGALVIEGRLGGCSKRDAKRALGLHVGTDSYLEALARDGARRVNLDGSDAGAVEEMHREQARERLAMRQAKRRKSASASD
jgi:sRNA-binding protein